MKFKVDVFKVQISRLLVADAAAAADHAMRMELAAVCSEPHAVCYTSAG